MKWTNHEKSITTKDHQNEIKNLSNPIMSEETKLFNKIVNY